MTGFVFARTIRVAAISLAEDGCWATLRLRFRRGVVLPASLSLVTMMWKIMPRCLWFLRAAFFVPPCHYSRATHVTKVEHPRDHGEMSTHRPFRIDIDSVPDAGMDPKKGCTGNLRLSRKARKGDMPTRWARSCRRCARLQCSFVVVARTGRGTTGGRTRERRVAAAAEISGRVGSCLE